MDEQNLATVTTNTVFAPRNRLNELQYEFGRNDPARGTRVNQPERERADWYEARTGYGETRNDYARVHTSQWNNHYCEYLEQEVKDLKRYVDSLNNRIVELESLVLNALKDISSLKDSIGFKYFEWDDYDG